MSEISLGGAAQSVSSIQSNYMAQVHRRRLCSGLALLIFVVLMVSGFNVADERNAGGFWDGLHQIGDYPADVLTEAWEKRADLPALIAKYFPALVETINIAAVSTLIGAVGGLLLSLLGTRGLAKWPRLIPLFRRMSDIMRAVPEIVIALVLIFVLGGGPVPAMIAIAIHTAGAMGKLFSEVNENADLKPIEGLRSVGANWSQQMMLGVVPQVAPNWLSYALLRFEVNIRASAILGFVGAGGLGYELRNAISWGQGRYDEAAAIFLLLFITIVVVDQASSYYREVLTHGRSGRE
jgi:phosphonate transport system permease protein